MICHVTPEKRIFGVHEIMQTTVRLILRSTALALHSMPPAKERQSEPLTLNIDDLVLTTTIDARSGIHHLKKRSVFHAFMHC
jgi:hypothetical protein